MLAMLQRRPTLEPQTLAPQTLAPQTPVPQTPVPQTPVPQTPVPQTPRRRTMLATPIQYEVFAISKTFWTMARRWTR